MAASTNSVLGLDPPTAGIANDMEQLPIHDKLNLQNDERDIPTIGKILDLNSTIAGVSSHGVPYVCIAGKLLTSRIFIKSAIDQTSLKVGVMITWVNSII